MIAAVSGRYEAGQAECWIFTFKEGLLSAVAHDLKLRVTKLAVVVDGESGVEATFDAGSLVVATPREDGRDAPGLLSGPDKRTIEGNIRADVLEAHDFPEIRFASTRVARENEGWRVEGKLTLHGRTRSIAFTTRAEGGKQVAEITLHQPDFGIRPYRAMLGTLRIAPDVRVRVEVPFQA
jgi:hypothetical protein